MLNIPKKFKNGVSRIFEIPFFRENHFLKKANSKSFRDAIHISRKPKIFQKARISSISVKSSYMLQRFFDAKTNTSKSKYQFFQLFSFPYSVQGSKNPFAKIIAIEKKTCPKTLILHLIIFSPEIPTFIKDQNFPSYEYFESYKRLRIF